MKRIQLWIVEEEPGHKARAVPVDEAADTETERRLEDLLVASSRDLLDGVTLIGRQVPTEGGPLDLVGVDQDGRLVVFELKRGTLTRDAVAQILDYASDLAARDPDDFSRLIEAQSGQRGIDRIEDFTDWYNREYPNADHILAEPPRMVLVGIGADERATRVVNFLAGASIDIKLLTFHAFRSDGRLVLARQVETAAPVRRPSSGGQTKEENLRQLLELAEEAGTKELLLQVADFVESRMQCYRWPGKSAFSFSLQGRTAEGKPSLHSYLTAWAQRGRRGAVVITFPPRAEATAPDAVADFLRTVEQARRTDSSWMAIEVPITEKTWPTLMEPLGKLLTAIAEGWRRGEAVDDEGSAGEGELNS